MLSTITTYERPDEAEAARLALESAGIEALVGEDLKLRVRQADAIRAGDVLESLAPWPGEREIEEEPQLAPPCPCEVCEPMRSARGVAFFFVAVLLVGLGLAFGAGQAAFFGILAAAVYFLITDRWRCAECGASWN